MLVDVSGVDEMTLVCVLHPTKFPFPRIVFNLFCLHMIIWMYCILYLYSLLQFIKYFHFQLLLHSHTQLMDQNRSENQDSEVTMPQMADLSLKSEFLLLN